MQNEVWLLWATGENGSSPTCLGVFATEELAEIAGKGWHTRCKEAGWSSSLYWTSKEKIVFVNNPRDVMSSPES